MNEIETIQITKDNLNQLKFTINSIFLLKEKLIFQGKLRIKIREVSPASFAES